jgi:hypothetical protein
MTALTVGDETAIATLVVAMLSLLAIFWVDWRAVLRGRSEREEAARTRRIAVVASACLARYGLQ